MNKFFEPIRKRMFLILSILLLFVSLFFSYTIITSLDYFSLNQQTTVGSIYLDNIEASQYNSHISINVNDWKEKSSYKLIYQNIEFSIDLNYFDLSLEDTVENIREGQDNEVFFSFSDVSGLALRNELEDAFSKNIIDFLLFDTLIDDVLNDIEDMNVLKTYRLEKYLETSLALTTIDQITLESIDPADVNQIATQVTDISIIGNRRFSILESLANYSLTNQQLSIIASAIQKVTQSTPFNGYIFSQYRTKPAWADQGLNVMVLKTNQYDFTFFNPLDFNYTIQIAKATDTSITVSLVGYPYANQYTVEVVESAVLEYQTEYSINEDLNETIENIVVIDEEEETVYRLLIQNGEDGKVITWLRHIVFPDSTESTITIYREIYSPIPEIYQENYVPKVGD